MLTFDRPCKHCFHLKHEDRRRCYECLPDTACTTYEPAPTDRTSPAWIAVQAFAEAIGWPAYFTIDLYRDYVALTGDYRYTLPGYKPVDQQPIDRFAWLAREHGTELFTPPAVDDSRSRFVLSVPDARYANCAYAPRADRQLEWFDVAMKVYGGVARLYVWYQDALHRTNAKDARAYLLRLPTEMVDQPESIEPDDLDVRAEALLRSRLVTL